MARTEGLEEIGGFLAADLADHDVIRSVSEGMPDEVADGEGALAEVARLEADGVCLVDAQFQGVLDRDYALVVGKQFDEGV